MNNKFLKILGLDHKRFVGIAKDNGKAYDFYILNIGGYRPPETPEEKQACLLAAHNYYNDCRRFATELFEFSTLETEITNEMIDEECNSVY